MATLEINGKKETIGDGVSIKDFLESREINPQLVACELNLKIIRRHNLADVILKDGDVLEVIRMIGGG